MAHGQLDRGQLLAAIYEAGVDPDKWPMALSLIREALGGEAICLFSRDSTLALKHADCFAFDGYTPEALAAYQQYYGSLDTRTPPVAACPEGTVYIDDRQMSFDKIKETEIFQDWFRPQRLGYGIATPLFKEGGRHGVLSTHRRLGRSNFAPHSIELFEYLSPHVVRALQVNRQIQRARIVADSFRVSLDHFPTAVLLVTGTAAVVHMNAMAEQLIRDPDCPIGVKEDRIFVQSARETDQLRSQIARATGLAYGVPDQPGALLSAMSPTTLRRFGIMVSPIGHGFPIGMEAEGLAIVFISDPSRPVPMDFNVLVQEFGLTPAEARLATSLAAGESIATIAGNKRISIETARSLLKRAMAKTETRSQGQLVAKIWRSLALLRRD